MKILFITTDLIAGNLAHIMTQEGHDVKLYIHEKQQRRNFDYLVKKTKNWKKEIDWVGKDGLIVFDDVGYGKIQENLRKKGYTVFGSSFLGDRLELDREHAQDIFKKHGFKTKETKDFNNIIDAIEFVQKYPKRWVVKQNGSASKTINYVGHFKDGRDVISLLKNYAIDKKINKERITLQERVDGIEIAVARAFNGTDWVGPIKLNIEHKKFFPGNIGPTTSEMGTLSWFTENENNKLFKETLGKLKSYLQKANFRGEIDINCIVNEKGAFPLESTSRFGSPIVHLHSEIQTSPWGEFLYAVAKGIQYDLKWKKGFGVVILVAVPPFPYAKKIQDMSDFFGLNIFFDKITPEELNHIHFEEVSRDVDNREQLYISDTRGYVLYVTGVGKNTEESMEKTYGIIEKIIIPKKIYRNDIGLKFITEDSKKLKEWGYLD